jgi:hypothetical protein
MRERLPILMLAAFLGAIFTPFVIAASSDRVPIQADLVQTLEAGHIQIGSPVYAKVRIPWQNNDCNLRQGSILEGRVVDQKIHSKNEKVSQLELLFDGAQCTGTQITRFPVSLVAVVAPDPPMATQQYESPPLNEAVGIGIEGGMRSVSQATTNAYFLQPERPKADHILAGQTLGMGKLKLQAGSGKDGSSIFSVAGHNVRLATGTQFVLLPTLNLTVDPSAKSSADAKPSATQTSDSPNATPVIPEADEIEECLPPTCNVSSEVNSGGFAVSTAAATLPVRQFGFPELPTHEMTRFDYEAAVSYLGTNQLFFAFNPHVLIKRTIADAAFPQLHLIRGVLIDLKTLKTEKTIEWRLPDRGRYLWPVGGKQILLHVNHELRLYGPDLKLLKTFPLEGALAFVCASPSGNYFAVGVTKERHTDFVHEQLREAEGREPEEDIGLTVLDSDFHVLATVTRSSWMPPPVLSNQGEIRVLFLGRDKWRILESRWDHQQRVIAQVTSTCLLHTTSLPGNFLFVVGCEAQGGKWYRTLRPDGKPLLKGESPTAELEHAADGSAQGNNFAIRVATSVHSQTAESTFHSSDLESEQVRVYRTENGQRLIAVHISSPVPSVQTFALSPTGSQLTVVTKDQLAFYIVP